MRALLIVLLASESVRLPAQEGDAPMFRAGATDVKVDAQVVQNGHIVWDLAARDFAITDQDHAQPITYFGRDSEPLSLVLLLDISGSMQRWIDSISSTAREALSHLRPGDRVAILVFGKSLVVHQGFNDNLAESARQLMGAVRDHDVGSGTAINAAVTAAAEYVHREAGPRGRRAILILTDNLSISEHFSDVRVIKALYDADTVLNAIVVGRAIRPGPPRTDVYRDPGLTPADVFKLAEETGGEAVKVDEPDLSFPEIIERIRTRYSMSYHAPLSVPGSYRRIAVTLTPDALLRYPGAQVRARHGYYAAP